MNKLYLIFGILTVMSQGGISIVAFYSGKAKEGIIGSLFAIANGIIYLWKG
jgi:hypothetical protein